METETENQRDSSSSDSVYSLERARVKICKKSGLQKSVF